VSTQLVSEHRGTAVLSRTAVAPDGARAMLLHAPGLFRLDVQQLGDTVRTVIRNLSDAEAESTTSGYSQPVWVSGELDGRRPARFEVTVALDSGNEQGEIRIIVGAMCDVARGVTTFTAQAIVAGA
jgi:hypothetical protein